jgi:hypothetical protein
VQQSKTEQYQKHHHQLPASILRLSIDAQETSETVSITATLTESGCSLFISRQPWNFFYFNKKKNNHHGTFEL